MSVVVVATITPAPGRLDAVRQAFLDVIPAVHEEEGCELYALHEAGDRLVMIERWSSQEALTTHMTAPALRSLGPVLAPLLAAAPEVTVLTPLPTGTKGSL